MVELADTVDGCGVCGCFCFTQACPSVRQGLQSCRPRAPAYACVLIYTRRAQPPSLHALTRLLRRPRRRGINARTANEATREAASVLTQYAESGGRADTDECAPADLLPPTPLGPRCASLWLVACLLVRICCFYRCAGRCAGVLAPVASWCRMPRRDLNTHTCKSLRHTGGTHSDAGQLLQAVFRCSPEQRAAS
jgi:hypothetical protein